LSGSQLDSDLWISEYVSPHDIYQHGIETLLCHKRTAFQDMYIVQSGIFGKALVLDGKWQSCTGDEFMYHEPLVHVACVHHSRPKKVLVLGGGEGATVREVLRWHCVEQVVMVDIDGEVVDACIEHLPEMHQGAFDDPRTELVVGDALHYLDQSENQWDIIISDLSDPIEEGPSFQLFTREYFQKCQRALAPGGTFVVQAGPISPPRAALHVRLARTVADVFPHILSYGSGVASYASPWGFVVASETPIDTQPTPADIDAMLATQTTGGFKMFDGIALLGLLNSPKYLRDAIAVETQVYTQDAPPAFFGKGVAGQTS